MNQNIPIAIPVTNMVKAANGELTINSRVKTKYLKEEGGDGK